MKGFWQQLWGGTGGVRLVHVIVITLSLILTLSAWSYSKRQIEKRVAQRFEDAQNSLISLIRDRMLKYEDALWSGVATLESHGGDISAVQWSTFAEALKIEEKYPGINGIGVIHYHTAATIDGYLRDQRRLRPDFDVFPDHAQPERMPITYIEPVDMNAAAVGLDIAHETNRRTAALASRDTGTAQITGPIVLVQDADSTPGFLFYAPFYANGGQVPPAQRAAEFRGAVYAPFVVHKLMQGLLAKDQRYISVSIRDADELIYDEYTQPNAIIDPDPMFSREVAIDLYGRTWVLDIRTNSAFRDANIYLQPTLILVAGLIVEGLIIALLVLLTRANARAVAYADRVTAALHREKEKLQELNSVLEIKNEEIEQFAYVASHDLKTPIRGIAGLAEMIEEDLEAYFQTPNANPDVSANLAHIKGRVKHMNNLTWGILQFSQTVPGAEHADAIVLTDIISALRDDFDLSTSQLTFDGNVQTVTRDTVNFRRVLENLVSNAQKYHDHPENLRIKIVARNTGAWLRVKVSDNGPGIAPKFHDKVFDVFQTLGIAGQPESTGIGLAIVKKAVKNNGGDISISKAQGGGAAFTFTWPANPVTQEQRSVA